MYRKNYLDYMKLLFGLISLTSANIVLLIGFILKLKMYFLIVLTGLVFSEYLLSGQVPSIKEVNEEEPLFPVVPLLNAKPTYKVS